MPVNVTVSGNAGQPGVQVSSPANNSTVSSPAHFVASATTSCAQGVAAMGVYTADNALAYSANGSTLDTNITLDPGSYNAVVHERDKCGGASKSPVAFILCGGGAGGKNFYSLQKGGVWPGYALLPPQYNIGGNCQSGGPQTSWW